MVTQRQANEKNNQISFMHVINFQGHPKVISDNPKIKREKTWLIMLKQETIAGSARINLNSNYLQACLNHCLTPCSLSER